MSDKTVIFKKACGKTNDPVFVKQFLILQDGDKRKLALKFVNERDEAVTAVTVSVRVFDGDGTRISVFERRIPVYGGAKKAFVPEADIELDGNACDCSVSVVSAEYGAYEYGTRNGETSVTYIGSAKEAKREDREKNDRTAKAGKDGITVTRRKLNNPLLVTVAIIAALIFVALAVYVQLLIFVGTEKTFLHAGVEYAFENDDSSDGTDIYAVGFHGSRANIVIPDEIGGHKVKGVKKKAFKNDSSLVSIAFESEVFIEDGAFENCANLKTAEFEKIVSLGKGAFKNCSMLESAVIPAVINELPSETFRGCTKLAEIVFEKSTEPVAVGANAFNGCTGIETADFGRRIDFEKGTRAVFVGATVGSLHILDYDVDNSVRISELFGVANANSTSEVRLGGLSVDYLTSIPEGFCKNLPIESFEVKRLDDTTVSADAFYGCNKLSDFVYSGDITGVGARAFYGTAVKTFDGSALAEIGEKAFAENKALDTVTLTGNTAIESIGDYAFNGCSKLTRIFIPVKIASIGAYTFAGCESLNSVRFADSAEIEEIGKSAFEGCSALGRMSGFGESLTAIGARAFAGCGSLTEFTVPDSLQSIAAEAFYACGSLTEFTVPDGVTFIGKGAFKDCGRLKKLSIPFIGATRNDSVSDGRFLAYVFGGSNHGDSNAVPVSLSSVTVTNATSIPSKAFYNLSGLRQVVVLSPVSVIGESAFYGCSKLSEITLPSTLGTIKASAFSGCSSLKEFTVPSGVNLIESEVFKDCISLEKLTVPFVGQTSDNKSDRNYLAYFFGGASYKDSYIVPNTLAEVVVTNAARIYDYAFYDCFGLKSIVLPDRLKTVGNMAFYGCYALDELLIPDGVETIGYGIILNTPALKKLTVPFIGNVAYGRSTNYDYGTSFIHFYSYGQDFGYGAIGSALKELTVTATTGFAADAFAECRYIERINIDCNVATFADGLFDSCYKLVEIYNLGEKSQKLTAGEGAAEYVLAVFDDKNAQPLPRAEKDGFRFVNGKQTVDKNSWYMLDYALNEDGKAVLPESVQTEEYSFDSYAMWRSLFSMSFLSEIEVPYAVTELGDFAFSQCQNLVRVDLSSANIKSIPKEAFSYCGKLDKVVLPDRLTTIGERAFWYCSRLKKIDLPKALKSIDEMAFEGCLKLFEVYNRSNLEITPQTAEHGKVAYNARKVYSAADLAKDPNIALPSVTAGGVQYIMLGDDNIDWWAVDFTGETDTLELKPFDHGGKRVDRVGIYGNAFDFSVVTGVKKIIIGNIVNAVNTEFDLCYNTESIELTNNGGYYDIIDIGEQAFANFDRLVSVKSDVRIGTLAARAFNTVKLERADFNKRVDKICADAFFGDMFNVKLKTTFADIGVIEENAFSGCASLSEFKSGNIENIDFRAFAGAKNLASVETGNVGVIGERAFDGCGELKTVKLGSAEQISNYAFINCGVLGDFSMGKGGGALEIGEGAFMNTALSKFEFAGDVSSIGQNAFLQSNKLKEVSFGGNTDVIGAYAFSNSAIEKATFVGNVGTVGVSAFANCYSLKEINFNGSLNTVGESAFMNCNGIKQLVLPDSVTHIMHNAFSYNMSLRQVTLPRSLTELASTAFMGCGNILSVYNKSNINVEFGYFDNPIIITNKKEQAEVTYVKDGSCEFAKVNNEWYLIAMEANYINWYDSIPDSFTDGGVKTEKFKIAKYTFAYYYGRSVVVGENIVGIMNNAFAQNITVFYKGDSAGWDKIYNGDPEVNAMFYKDCIHGDEVGTYWRYNNGEPTTSVTYIADNLWTVSEKATCLHSGLRSAHCNVCNKDIKEVVPALDHSISGGKCTACGNSAIKITSGNFGSAATGVSIANDPVYKFTVTAAGVITSTNKVHSSESTLTVTAVSAVDLMVKYLMSSERLHDRLIVAVNGVTRLEASGADGGVITLRLNAGDAVTFKYSKDGSVDGGNDCATIEELTVITAEGRQ